MTELNLEPLSVPPLPPGGLGGDWKLQPCNRNVGSPGNQPTSLDAVQKLPHSHNKRHLDCSGHLGNTLSFRSFGAKDWTKTKFIFLTIDHNIIEPVMFYGFVRSLWLFRRSGMRRDKGRIRDAGQGYCNTGWRDFGEGSVYQNGGQTLISSSH